MPEIIDGETFFTAKEAAEIKGVGKSTILKAISGKRLIAARTIGNTQFILESDLSTYRPGSYGVAVRETVPRGPGRAGSRSKGADVSQNEGEIQ